MLIRLTTFFLLLLMGHSLVANAKPFQHQDNWTHKQGIKTYLKQLGPRPFFLVEDMDEGELKKTLQKCSKGPYFKSDFSIGHRGAPLQFPEHTKESYIAAAEMGAGIIECDVTFTQDKELVCRHSQCDLHTTTNILGIPKLAAKCSVPFSPADPISGTPASAKCCTSDITLNEFKSLCGTMDASNPNATNVNDYMKGTAEWRTDLYSTCGSVVSHTESIKLIKSLGAKFTPELKSPEIEMPFQGDYTQEEYAQQMINEYKSAGIKAKNVWAQSFNIDDVRYWIENEPRFGKQAVYLDDRIYDGPSYDPSLAYMEELRNQGIRIIAPPMWALLSLDEKNNITPSEYALNAKAAGLDIITWTLERSGPLKNGGGWYHQSIADAINNDGDTMNVLHILAQDVGVKGVFSDWPATVTYYANCMGLK